MEDTLTIQTIDDVLDENDGEVFYVILYDVVNADNGVMTGV